MDLHKKRVDSQGMKMNVKD